MIGKLLAISFKRPECLIVHLFITGHPALPGGLFWAIGNPLNDGTWQYEWVNGRQLARMYSVDTDASFVYNENGLRVQKTVNGAVTKYTLYGKDIKHMTTGSDELHFFYDVVHELRIVRESIPDVTYCFSFEVCPCQKCNVNMDVQESKTYYRWK